jgi:hypothetical protein
MSDASKSEPIRPTINDVNRPFWDACARGELRLQRCLSCGHLRYPAAIVCPECLSAETEWQAVSGEKGRFTIAEQNWQSWAHPVVSGGRLYLRDQGILAAYDIAP